MKRNILHSLLCLTLTLALILALALTANAQKASAAYDPADPQVNTAPTLTIAYKNLSYSSDIYVLYAVNYQNVTGADVQMLFWNAPQDEYLKGTETYAVTDSRVEAINGVNHRIFYSRGVAPKELTENQYCCAYIRIGEEEYYSEVVKFSPLAYVKTVAGLATMSEADRDLANALRAYANAAQIRFQYRTDDLASDTHYDITLQDAVLEDGFSYGIYKEGTQLTLTAVVPAGDSVARWIDGNGTVTGSEGQTSITYTLSADSAVRALMASDPASCEHEYSAWIAAADATCTEAGAVGHYHCDLCGRNFDANYDVIDGAVVLPALGHNWVDVAAVPATCVDGCTAYRYCDRCSLEEGKTVIPATDPHDYVENVVAPAGEARGYIDHVCSVCGDSYKTDYDYSLYSGVNFVDEGKFPIDYNFDSSVYTIEASVQLPVTQSARAGVIIGNYGTSTNSGKGFNFEIYSNGRPRLYFTATSLDTNAKTYYDYIFNADIRGTEVKNIAVVIDSNARSAKLYVDGVLAEEKTLDHFEMPELGRTLVLGGDNRTGNSQSFKGTIYSATVYRDVRTDEEIVSDLVLADATDQNCCVSYNLLDSTGLTGAVTLDNILDNAQVTTAEELAYHASHGTRNIEIMNDITVDRTIYVISDVTVFSNGDYTLLRDPDFYSDIFVVGENAMGRNLTLDGIACVLNLGKAGATGTLTVDGNKTNVTGDVYGTLIYVSNAGTVNINGAVLTNNKKVGNARSLGLEQSYCNMIGGAAIVNVNGTVTLNSGAISNCEINTTDLSGGDSSAENYRQSMYGGAIYNVSNFTMNGGTISGTGNYAAHYGGAIANRGRCEILGGVIENNRSYAAGGSIYMIQSYSASLIVGNQNGNATDVIFRNNYSNTNGGAVYAASYASILIHGGATFDGNAAKTNGGAIYAGTQCAFGENTVFTANSAKTGGAVYFASVDSLLVHKSFEGVTFTGNSATSYGGAVYCGGTELEISDCVFTANRAGTEAGAIYAAVYSDVTIEDSSFTRNECTNGHGGAVTLRGTEASISGSTFTENTASSNGGAGYVSYTTVTDDNNESSQVGSNVTLTDNTFTDNEATNGGALYAATNSTVTGSGNTFSGNTANASYDDSSEYQDGGLGGGVFFSNSTVSLSGETFTGNSGYDGAGLYANGGTTTLTGVTATGNTAAHVGGFTYTKSNALTITGSSVIGSTTDASLGNSSGNNGGALYGDTGATMSLSGVTFGNNTAGNAGGVIYVRNHFTAVNSQFINNSAKYGGALFIYSTTDASVEGCTFSGNQATDSYGGAVYINAGTNQTAKLHAEDTSFTGNSSIKTGGAVYINTDNTLEAEDCSFTNNSSNTYGGAVQVQSGGTLTAVGSSFTGNTATSGGGAIATYKSSANQNPETITLTNVTLDSNSSANGGALYLSEANVTLSGTATNNSTSASGAVGYMNLGSELTVTAITATGNRATNYGGCFYVNRSTLNMTNDQAGQIIFGALESDDPQNPVDVDSLKNSSDTFGGVVYATVDTVIYAKNAVFANNTSYNYGGAICVNPASGTSTLTLDHAQFIGNQNTRTNSSTAYGGGAIAAMATSTVTDTGSVFSGNSASYGGAIFATGTASVSLTGTSFEENIAANYDGGAIHVHDSAALSCSNVTFRENNAKNGGAISNVSSGAITVSNAQFVQNTARTTGGAINTTGTGTMSFTDSAFTSNSAASHGGAVRLYAASGSGAVSFTRCSFTTNAANGANANGGAIYSASATVATLTDVSFNGNTSKAGTDNAIYCAGTSQTTIDGITFYLPCGTPQIGASTTNVRFTIYQNKVYDQYSNALTASDYVSGGTVTYQ